MNSSAVRQRFYYSSNKNRFGNLLLISVCWVGTVALGYSSRRSLEGIYLLILSLAYPLIIISNILRGVKTLSYVDMDSVGLQVTIDGLFHKKINWDEIESLTIIKIHKTDFIAINYRSAFKRHSWMVNRRLKIFGYEEVLAQANPSEGHALTDIAQEYFNNKQKRDAGGDSEAKQVKPTSSPVRLKRSFRLSDTLLKPVFLAWLGASLACTIIAGTLEHRNPEVSSILKLTAFICIGLGGASSPRYRRMMQNSNNKQDKSNDWSNLM
jgi:hypothetical protein